MERKLIRFFILGYLLTFPFGQLARLPIEVFGPQIRVYLGDVLVFLAVGIWGIWRLRGRKAVQGEKPPLSGPILAFAAAAAFSLLVNLPRLAAGETLIAGFYLLRWVTYSGLYFVVWDIKKIQSNQNPKLLTSHPKPRASLGFGAGFSLLNLLMLVGGLAATFGLLQYFWFPDLRTWLESQNWDPHYYRAYGTFFDPGFLGIIMVLTLILVTEKILNPNKVKHTIYYLLLLVCYLALALTYSRASYLAFLAGMGVIAWRLKKPKFFAGVLGVFLLTILLLPRPGGEGVRLERESTVEARIRNWKQSLVIAKDHFLFGVGFNSYRYSQRDYGFLAEDTWQETHAGAGADSSLLFVLATTGIVGLTAYLLFLKKILHTTYYIPHTRGSLAVFASLTAVLAHSFFLNSLFYPWVMGWMFLLLGSSEPKSSDSVKNSLGLRILVLLNFLRVNKSLSPVVKISALPKKQRSNI